jgi:ribosomal silencing factor RsfS
MANAIEDVATQTLFGGTDGNHKQIGMRRVLNPRFEMGISWLQVSLNESAWLLQDAEPVVVSMLLRDTREYYRNKRGYLGYNEEF